MNDLAGRRAKKDEQRLLLQAQRLRHLQEVKEQNRRDRKAKADKRRKGKS